MSSVITNTGYTSRFLRIKIIDSNLKKFGYNEYPLRTSNISLHLFKRDSVQNEINDINVEIDLSRSRLICGVKLHLHVMSAFSRMESMPTGGGIHT